MSDSAPHLNPYRFKKGVSGNPGGRPKGNPAVKELLKKHSEDAAKKLVELLYCGLEKVELAAAQEILNRTEGKPLQEQNISIHGSVNVRDQVRNIFKEYLLNNNPNGDSDSNTDSDGTAEPTAN